MEDTPLKIIKTNGVEIPHSSDGVEKHVYNGKTYYVKSLMMNKKII